MHVGWLELRDFRAYPRLELHPSPGVNVLVGRNATGKTTVLEAVGYASALRSFRRTPDAALIRTGADTGVIRAGFAKEAGETRVEIELPEGGRRRVLVNGKRPGRLADVAGLVPVVAFLPDDLELVKGGSGLRRRYLDELGAQLSPGYGGALAEYEQTLRQRNALLRRHGPAADRLTLEVWDTRLVETGVGLWSERVEMGDRLAPVLDESHTGVAGSGSRLDLLLRPAWGDAPYRGFDPEEAGKHLAAELVARRGRELEQRTTTVGPHRDGIRLVLAGRDARAQASQGEQRSVAVALRVAAYHLLKDRHGHPPVLLLDDVFSELDLSRTAALAEMLPAGQVFVTTTRDDEVPVAGRRWNVEPGSVSEGRPQ